MSSDTKRVGTALAEQIIQVIKEFAEDAYGIHLVDDMFHEPTMYYPCDIEYYAEKFTRGVGTTMGTKSPTIEVALLYPRILICFLYENDSPVVRGNLARLATRLAEVTRRSCKGYCIDPEKAGRQWCGDPILVSIVDLMIQGR